MPQSGQVPGQAPGKPPEPEGHFAGIPYDWRRPTAERVASRWWNGDDRRLFPPKSYGWGYSINLYWLVHPLRFFAKRS